MNKITLKRIQIWLKYSPQIFKQFIILWNIVKEVITETNKENIEILAEIEKGEKNVNNNNEK